MDDNSTGEVIINPADIKEPEFAKVLGAEPDPPIPRAHLGESYNSTRADLLPLLEADGLLNQSVVDTALK